MDDCLWRNREQGNGWVLFVDLDELVTLPGVPGGFKGLVSRLEEEKYESANFHSVGYLSNYCDAEYDGEAYGAAPAAVVPAAAGAGGGGRRRRGLAERMVFRAVFPEGCDDIFQHNCSFNNVLAAGGRRKVRRLRARARASLRACDAPQACCRHAFASLGRSLTCGFSFLSALSPSPPVVC